MADQDVQIIEYDWANLVLAVEGEGFYKKPIAYEFQGREFKDKGADSDIYDDIYGQLLTDPNFLSYSSWPLRLNLNGLGNGYISNSSTTTTICAQTVSPALIVGQDYKSTIEITTLISGYVNVVVGGHTSTNLYSPGTYTFRHTSSSGSIVGVNIVGQTSADDAVVNSLTMRRA